MCLIEKKCCYINTISVLLAILRLIINTVFFFLNKPNLKTITISNSFCVNWSFKIISWWHWIFQCPLIKLDVYRSFKDYLLKKTWKQKCFVIMFSCNNIRGKVKIITINIYIATISIFIPFQNIFNANTEKYKLDKKNYQEKWFRFQ